MKVPTPVLPILLFASATQGGSPNDVVSCVDACDACVRLQSAYERCLSQGSTCEGICGTLDYAKCTRCERVNALFAGSSGCEGTNVVKGGCENGGRGRVRRAGKKADDDGSGSDNEDEDDQGGKKNKTMTNNGNGNGKKGDDNGKENGNGKGNNGNGNGNGNGNRNGNGGNGNNGGNNGVVPQQGGDLAPVANGSLGRMASVVAIVGMAILGSVVAL